MSDPIRVVVVDHHLIVREGLRLILETVPDIELVGEAGNGREAWRPAVVLATQHGLL